MISLHELADGLRAGYGETIVVLLGVGAFVGATANSDG